MFYIGFPSIKNSDHVVVVLFSNDFSSNSERDAPFHHTAYDDFHDYWDGLGDHLREILQEDIFKLSPSAAGIEFC